MIVNNCELKGQVIDRIRNSYHIVLDVETNGLNCYGANQNIGVALYFPNYDESYYIPIGHAVGTNLDWASYQEIIRELTPDKLYQGWNFKFDLGFMRKDGMSLPNFIQDVMIMAWLMNENEKNFKLKPLADKYLGKGASGDESVLTEKLRAIKAGKADMRRLSPEDVAPYAEQDVRITYGLYEFYKPHLEVWDLWDIWVEYNYYERVIFKMEQKGMLLDVQILEKYYKEAEEMLEIVGQRIEEMVGYKINLNSSKQVNTWLGLESSRAEILDEIYEATGREDIKLLIDYRGWSKVMGTYYKKFLELMDNNHVLHPSFHITGTVSGRLSCSKPNLQAIPQYTEIYKVKDVFKAREGKVLISSDLSQAEIRLNAFVSGEETIIEKIQRRADLHTETSEELGIPRNSAKRINFSIIYGIGVGGLMESLKIDRKTAKMYLDRYHKAYPNYKRHMYEMERLAKSQGYIRLWTGRARRYETPDQCHKASSNEVQGGVAEMMRHAMMKLDFMGYEIVNQIHDDVIIEVDDNPETIAQAVADIQTVMTDFPFMNPVPMDTDTKIGKYWGSMKEVKHE